MSYYPYSPYAFQRPTPTAPRPKKKELGFFSLVFAVMAGVGAFSSLAYLGVTSPQKSAIGERVNQGVAHLSETTTSSTVIPVAADTPKSDVITQAASAPAQTAAPQQPTTTVQQAAAVVVGGVQLVSCKPKPGVDAGAFWTEYMKGGGSPNWDYVRGQVCA